MRLEAGRIDPSVPITSKIKPEDGPDACKMLQEKNAGWIEVLIKP